eukprot:NP_491602.2 FER-1 Like [Caenorhabditis elegans]
MTDKEKLLKVKQKFKRGDSSSDVDSGPERDRDEDDSDNESRNTSKTSKSSKNGKSGKSTGTSEMTELLNDGGSDIELLPDNGKNFEKRKLQDTDKSCTWNVLVRIIEAKGVSTGSARVRTIFDGKSKMTRTVTHAIPKWRQNILYTMKNQPLEKLAAKVLTFRLVRPTALGESSVGEFSCYLSEVIRSPDRSLIAKWVALGFPGMSDEEPDDIAYENCGFLKVTLSVYRIDESPPTLIDDGGKEQIWSGIRVFSVEQLIRKMINERKIKKKQRFYVMVQCGAHKTKTTMESAFLDEDANIASIIFSLFDKKGRGKTCIGKATLPMKMIYEPGVAGYLPTFGPAFLNVFDCERVSRFSIFSRKMRGSQLDGSRFVGRLFIAIDCVEYMEKANAQIMHLDYSQIMEAESICKNLKWYNCFCSMSLVNKIDPQFASDPVCIMMSIGSFGSTSNEDKKCNSSTVPTYPERDEHECCSFAWGNLRPVAEVNAPWEVIDRRIEMSNVLMKMTNMLDSMISEIRHISSGAVDQIASVGIESLECLEQQIESASKFLRRINHVNSNALDRHILDYRKEKILKLREHFEKEAFSIDYSDGEVDAKLLRMLLQIRSMTLELAEDVQMTIPPVLIKMMSHGKLIGFAKIPISEIFQSDDEAQSGEWCGRTRAINIQWPTLVDQRNRKREHVAVLHAKMWFGRTDQLTKWKEHVQPADIERFIVLYEVQTKEPTLKWKDESDIYDGKWVKTKEVPPLENEWNAVGPWIVMNTRQTFVPKLGQHTAHDKAFEIQKRAETGTWKHFQYTDCYADELKPKDLDKHVKGWQVGSWDQDKFRNNGDEKGCVYSTNGVFIGSGVLPDREEKVHHNFRKRCIERPRKHEGYNKEFEDFARFRKLIGNDKWEVSWNFE